MTCTPRHHPTSRPHFRPRLQECSESPQVKRTLWAFFRERNETKRYTFWLRSWSAPTSNLGAESDKIQVIYSIDWYLVFLTKCQIFKQLVPTWHSTSQHCYHDTSRLLFPGSDHTHSCNGRQVPHRIPQPESHRHICSSSMSLISSSLFVDPLIDHIMIKITTF